MRANRPMTEAERKKRPCAACGKQVGTATIVAGGPYPNAPLCLRCGTVVELDDVYEMIHNREKENANARDPKTALRSVRSRP